MGYKIKKEAKLQLQDFPRTKIKYNIAVPVLGIADALAMFNFFLNPATSGNLGLKIFFLIFALGENASKGLPIADPHQFSALCNADPSRLLGNNDRQAVAGL